MYMCNFVHMCMCIHIIAECSEACNHILFLALYILSNVTLLAPGSHCKSTTPIKDSTEQATKLGLGIQLSSEEVGS